MTRDSQSAAAPRLEPGVRVAAVLSSYHREITAQMLASARAELARAGLADADWLTVEVPGAFEIPLVARTLGMREDVHAVLCFGLLLKGETNHDFHIASAVSDALQRVALECDKPMLFGVLTCDTLAQAQARARSAEQGGLDKGREVARAALAALAALKQAAELGRQRRAGFFARPDGGQA